jgi:hypothetical protein
MGNREESPVRPADDLLDEPTRSTEGASLEIRRNQTKLSGKRTLLLKLSGKFPWQKDVARDTDGENSLVG